MTFLNGRKPTNLSIQETEFTLYDTYDYLKDIEKELHENIGMLVMKNETVNINMKRIPSTKTNETSRYMESKRRELIQKLLEYDYEDDIRTNPINKTVDANEFTLSELEQEIINIKKVFDRLKIEISNIKNNIANLENEKISLEKMKNSCVNAVENDVTSVIIHDNELINAKKMFDSVKKDLALTVDTIFPEHIEFKEVLGALTCAYIRKEGDNVYIPVNPKYTDCIQFLIEADIATYHRNDKNKIRLVDFL